MATKHLRILIVEDHLHLREQLILLMNQYEDMIVVGSGCNGEEAVALCDQLHPDVVLMDAVMPVMDGFTATELIRQRCPETRVVILSNGFLGETTRAMSAGASEFLLKPVASEEMVNALRRAHAGRANTVSSASD